MSHCLSRPPPTPLTFPQHEEVAEDLPPKYSLAVSEPELAKVSETKDAPPAYSSITVADAELPPKLDV